MIQIEKVCSALQSLVLIPFFDGQPRSERNELLYAWVRLVGDNTNNISQIATLEITFIAKPTVTNSQIRNKIEEITFSIIGKNCLKKYNFDGFRVYNVSEGPTRGPGYTDKKETVRTKQYNFTFLRMNP